MPLGHTLTNSFLEKFYRKLKKLSKLFQFPIKLFSKMVYYCVPLGHMLVKYFYFLFFIQERILIQPNLSVYVCETSSWRLEPPPLPPTLYKHLYLWSDHRTKGVRWCIQIITKCPTIFSMAKKMVVERLHRVQVCLNLLQLWIHVNVVLK